LSLDDQFGLLKFLLQTPVVSFELGNFFSQQVFLFFSCAHAFSATARAEGLVLFGAAKWLSLTNKGLPGAAKLRVVQDRCMNQPQQEYSKGSIVVEDRAYTDYQLFNNLRQNGIFFVTRKKTNAVYRVTDRRRVNKSQGLSSDQTIVLTGTKGLLCPQLLRRIGYRDTETKIHYVFFTNNFKLSAKIIADIYKERWQIEIFFRWIKQNLSIKAFFGNSRNAIMTQIYVALIAYLLLCMFKFMSKVSASLQKLIRVV
jgi:hypothetical protein